MIRRRGFLGGLIAAAFSPAISAKPADFNIAPGVERMRIDAAGNMGIGSIKDTGNLFLWKPQLVRIVPTVRGAGELVVQPMAKHISSLPIMAAMDIPGMPRREYDVSSAAPYEWPLDHDWMEQEQ